MSVIIISCTNILNYEKIYNFSYTHDINKLTSHWLSKKWTDHHSVTTVVIGKLLLSTLLGFMWIKTMKP